MENSRYWAYNLPLQLWPKREDEEDEGPVTGYRILNYMPRKESCITLDWEEAVEGETREEFLEHAALVLENLARLFRKAKTDPNMHIYYPDEGMNNEEEQ